MVLDHVVEATGRQGAMRGAQGQEDLPALTFGPALAQVSHDSVSDTGLEGKRLLTPGLGTNDPYLLA